MITPDPSLVRAGTSLWADPGLSLVLAFLLVYNTGRHFQGRRADEDITAQKQAQEALVRAERLTVTGRVAASLAHEINNSLQPVIGCLGLAQSSRSTAGISRWRASSKKGPCSQCGCRWGKGLAKERARWQS
jgi:signal transduction histidine kinase